MLDIDDVMVGFPDNDPAAAVVRFGPTDMVEAFPLPPDPHLAGFLLRQLNVLPPEEAKRAAALLFGVADRWTGSDALEEPLNAIQSLFHCRIPTGPDYSLLAVTKPLTRTRFLGTLVRHGQGWTAMKMSAQGFGKNPVDRHPFTFASIGAVYAGAIAAAAAPGLLIERARRVSEEMTGQVIPAKPSEATTYSLMIADLLHCTVGEIAMMYFEDMTGLTKEAANFVYVKNVMQKRQWAVLDFRDDAIAAGER